MELGAFWLMTGSVLEARQKWDGYHGIYRVPAWTKVRADAFGYMADLPKGSLPLWVPVDLLRGEESFSRIFILCILQDLLKCFTSR